MFVSQAEAGAPLSETKMVYEATPEPWAPSEPVQLTGIAVDRLTAGKALTLLVGGVTSTSVVV